MSLALLQLSSSSLPASALGTARHFALHALHHLIQTSWNALAEQEKEYIKVQCIAIVQNVSNAKATCGGVTHVWSPCALLTDSLALPLFASAPSCVAQCAI